ncbi:MAG: hypothetical protein MI923_26575 [Phycisphaerales bacterium]|nr:hypothetical protein [Phycisphaerales bacterium]
MRNVTWFQGLGVVLFVLSVTVNGHAQTSADVKPPSRPTVKPAPRGDEQGVTKKNGGDFKPSSGIPTVDAILDRLEAKGKAIKGLQCKLIYTYVMVEVVEDRQIKEGTLRFAQGKPNSRFFVEFDKKIAGGTVDRQKEYFLFDGEWLIERNDRRKNVIKRQIARKGERVDPFRLGKGPFPLPFGQKREEILKYFKVTLKPFELGDPLRTKHLHCVPRPNTQMAKKYRRVEIYVDSKLDLPVRIVSERLSDNNRIEVDFKEIDVDAAPAGSWFRMDDIPGDFSIAEEPLPEQPEIKAPHPSNR